MTLMMDSKKVKRFLRNIQQAADTTIDDPKDVLHTVQNILSDLEMITEDILGDAPATGAITEAKYLVYKAR